MIYSLDEIHAQLNEYLSEVSHDYLIKIYKKHTGKEIDVDETSSYIIDDLLEYLNTPEAIVNLYNEQLSNDIEYDGQNFKYKNDAIFAI